MGTLTVAINLERHEIKVAVALLVFPSTRADHTIVMTTRSIGSAL